MAVSGNKGDHLAVSAEAFTVTVEAMIEACASADRREVTMLMRNAELDVVVTNARYSEVARTLVSALNGDSQDEIE